MPNRYVAALMPVPASTYCGTSLLKSSYAALSSRDVNLSRALGCTTRLIAAARGFGFSGTSNSRTSANPSNRVNALYATSATEATDGAKYGDIRGVVHRPTGIFLWSASIASG